ncbi:hypothetical protein NQ318_016071 [Aromia moschata]|uniref:Uncharacterized protein n=1 Tax=Aromia moschata TaxID=1265417 RepID=A0AAV8XU76_9CUCU|nr:hypothetical protein NQ318_016071 [Aromia moschata]
MINITYPDYCTKNNRELVSTFLLQIKVVYTCGLCEVIVDEITDHPCIEGYGHIYIDNNHYFYPVLGQLDASIV